MKTFDVYKHPVQGYQAVKVGFSWPAFFFTWIWAFIKKLWGYGLAFIGVIFIFLVVETAFTQGGNFGGTLIMLLLQFGLFVLFGVKGNDWRNKDLKKRGYEHVQTLRAETPDAAVASVTKPNAD